MTPNLVANPHPFIKNFANPYTEELKQGSQHTISPDPTHGETVLAERTRDASIQDITEGGNLPTINTDVRFTYELDRYRKNSLLIFHNNCSDASGNTVVKVKETFETLRFEVEIVKDAPRRKVRTIMDKFFMRDFTEYGCVAVVVVYPQKEESSPSHRKQKHYHFNPEDFVRHFELGDQPTLKGKPKIFISEAYVGRTRAPHDHLNDDIYDLRFDQFKMFNKNITYNPLSILCDNLMKYAERKDFLKIVKISYEKFAKASKDIAKSNNPRDAKIALNSNLEVSTLSKELWLWKTS